MLKIIPRPYANVLGAINELARIFSHPKGIKKLSKEKFPRFKLSNIKPKQHADF